MQSASELRSNEHRELNLIAWAVAQPQCTGRNNTCMQANHDIGARCAAGVRDWGQETKKQNTPTPQLRGGEKTPRGGQPRPRQSSPCAYESCRARQPHGGNSCHLPNSRARDRPLNQVSKPSLRRRASAE